MNRATRVQELKRLQAKVDGIRTELGISPPGAILFQAQDDDFIIVEADGFGHATASIVEGNYPVDFWTKYERCYRTEKEAESAADALVTGKFTLSAVFGITA